PHIVVWGKANPSRNISMSKLRVTLNSKLTVVSSRPVSSGKVHTLSALDRGMGCHSLHVIFYYKNEDNWFKSFDLDPLRESLSEVLTQYPVLTGRLVRGANGEWEVKCNDAGVRTIKATVDATLHEWLKSASYSEEKLLVAWDDMPEDPSTWSPFRIQINSFQEGGVAIGVSCSHMMADLTFIASFFKSWTEFHSHFPITHPPLIAPLSTRGHASSSSSSSTKTASATNFATATFKFSSSTIKQCLSKVHDSCPNATPFDFLAALFWTRIASVRPPKTQDQTHSLRICSDFRSLLKPPLPIGYLGNALHFSTLSQKVKDVELGGIVSAVHWQMEKLSEIGASNEGKRVYGSELTCVCMEHLMEEEDQESLLYGAGFVNNEKPVHVSCRVGNVESEGLIMVMPSAEGGLSRSVTVMLAEEEVAELKKDEAIMELEAVMVLAGCGMDD
ncbi:hydroxycinnamoyltransferase-like, partial [Vigna umbellata]|uniref:hydroxycinnamoyltransferase-like n=1 Tax=Vigna umbellata TaxID=87088 RepID=UPI001F5F79A1